MDPTLGILCLIYWDSCSRHSCLNFIKESHYNGCFERIPAKRSLAIIQASRLRGSILICSYFESQRYWLNWSLHASRKLLSSLFLCFPPHKDYLCSIKNFSWWFSLRVSWLPWGGSLISLCLLGGLMVLMFREVDLLLLSSRWVPAWPSSPSYILLLSRFCFSRCVTFFSKRSTFSTKSVAFLKCLLRALISVSWPDLLLPFVYLRW